MMKFLLNMVASFSKTTNACVKLVRLRKLKTQREIISFQETQFSNSIHEEHVVSQVGHEQLCSTLCTQDDNKLNDKMAYSQTVVPRKRIRFSKVQRMRQYDALISETFFQFSKKLNDHYEQTDKKHVIDSIRETELEQATSWSEDSLLEGSAMEEDCNNSTSKNVEGTSSDVDENAIENIFDHGGNWASSPISQSELPELDSVFLDNLDFQELDCAPPFDTDSNNGTEPLVLFCENSTIGSKNAKLLIRAFIAYHRLSDVAQTDLIKLLTMIVP